MEEALENLKKKSALVLGGGGTLGIASIGSLKRLEELGTSLKNYKSVTGSSVGSIIGLGIVCGADANYMKNKLRDVDLDDLKNDECFLVEGSRLLKKFGLHSMKNVRKFVSSILTDFNFNPDITFQELYEKTKIWFTVTYLSLNYERTIYADYLYEPNSNVRETIIKSAAIPIFYESYFDKGEVCVDGGTQLNFPMIVPRLQGFNSEEILGLKFISSGDVESKDEGQPGIPEEDNGAPKNIIQFLTTIVNILRNQAMKVHVSEDDWKLTVKINVGTMSSTNFDLSEYEKDWLYSQGKDAVDKYVEEMIKREIF